ncbi:MAG: hypothetical protein RML40_08530 [Bacteroidota bacterium]|nr:hypothetical protein [Candidatus Kapabacteria bacterium]MDW8220561.1 hypothetical protein [Bacteroidota bacterium]
MIDESLVITVNMVKALGDRRSFVAGDAPSRLSTEFFKRVDTGGLVMRVHFGADTEGPPGLAHSGSIAAAFSEAMIFSAWAQGHGVLAIRLNTTYKQMLPLGSTVLIETQITIDGLRMTMHSTMSGQLQGVDAIFAEAEGLFMAIPAAKFGIDGHKVAQMFAALS